MRISKNFTLEEFTTSATAKEKHITNIPNQQQVLNIAALVHNVLQPLRDWHGKEIKIGSGFRSPLLNKAVDGDSNSQHMTGQAADLFIDGNKEMGRRWFEWIMENCDFDQLIWEHNVKGTYWVHVSYRSDGKNRRYVVNNLTKR